VSRSYKEDWNEYRRRRNAVLALWLAYVPAVFLVAYLCDLTIHSYTPAFAVAIAWMAASLIANYRVSAWPCPRCGKPFSSSFWRHYGLLARKCVHCGLPKYAEDATGRQFEPKRAEC